MKQIYQELLEKAAVWIAEHKEEYISDGQGVPGILPVSSD